MRKRTIAGSLGLLITLVACAANSAGDSQFAPAALPNAFSPVRPGDLWLDNPDYNYAKGISALEAFRVGAKAPFFTIESSTGDLRPCDIAFDASANLYVSRRPFTNSGYKLGGTVTVYPPGTTQPSLVLKKGISRPGQIAIDGKGILYVANFSLIPHTAAYIGWVSEYAPGSLTPLRKIKSTTRETVPLSFALDRADDLYVAFDHLASPGGSVHMYPPGATKPALTFKVRYPPLEMAFDSQGNIDVLEGQVNTFNGAVAVYTPQGKLVRTITEGIFFPVGITLDASGDLFVGNYLSGPGTHIGDVTEYAPGGSKVIWRIKPHGSPSIENTPQNVIFDRTANVLYVDASSTVQAYKPPSRTLQTLIALRNVGAMAAEPRTGLPAAGERGATCLGN